MKILFHTPQLDVRGTCVAIYDYADYNEILLGGKSVIITPRSDLHDSMAIHKFSKRFQIIFYDSKDQIEEIASGFDLFYAIKYGFNDGIVCKNIKSVIHCVFVMIEPHGDVYAAVSETLAAKFGSTTFVPHMIGLRPARSNSNLRESLGISSDSIVIGRHGGEDTFDLDIVKSAILNAVQERPELYFLFVNTPNFCNHPKVIHLDKIIDLDEKNRFIMSCDAMIHGQSMGETFGIAIGEFSVNNKPIIAYNGPVSTDNYKKILGDRAIWYITESECYNIFMTFNPVLYKNKNMNCYENFSPENVMKIFKKVFIDNL